MIIGVDSSSSGRPRSGRRPDGVLLPSAAAILRLDAVDAARASRHVLESPRNHTCTRIDQTGLLSTWLRVLRPVALAAAVLRRSRPRGSAALHSNRRCGGDERRQAVRTLPCCRRCRAAAAALHLPAQGRPQRRRSSMTMCRISINERLDIGDDVWMTDTRHNVNLVEDLASLRL